MIGEVAALQENSRLRGGSIVRCRRAPSPLISALRLKQYVADKVADVFLDFAVLPNHDDEVPGQMVWQDDPSQLTLVPIQRERPNRYKADAQPESDEIDDQIKAIELHGGFDPPALLSGPDLETLSGVRSLINLQPALPGNPFIPAFGRLGQTIKSGGDISGSNQCESVLETVRYPQGVR